MSSRFINVFNPEKTRAKIHNTPPGRHAIYIYINIYIYTSPLWMISWQEFLNKKINIFPRIMSCNHANLNIHTTHSTNIDRKTLWHFSLFCDLKSKIQKKKKKEKPREKKMKTFKNRKRMHLEVSGQHWHFVRVSLENLTFVASL